MVLADETAPSPPTDSEDCDTSAVFEIDPDDSSDAEEADNEEEDKGESIVTLGYVVKVVVAYWKVKTPCHAHGECIN